MTQAAASNREDVEQLQRRFEEFRRTHAVRSRLIDSPRHLLQHYIVLHRVEGHHHTLPTISTSPDA